MRKPMRSACAPWRLTWRQSHETAPAVSAGFRFPAIADVIGGIAPLGRIAAPALPDYECA